jgi:hypothetical protein
MFIPSAHLKEMIGRDDEIISKVAKAFKLAILSNSPIRLDKEMVKKYCKKTLDIRNKFILDNGDIKVIPVSIEISDLKKT